MKLAVQSQIFAFQRYASKIGSKFGAKFGIDKLGLFS